ncbi:MAG: rhomboid family intramembrane serine protease [Leptolyngbyaceae cyanobacterium SL_7_1]|nr:rhomboid family intramembrane serine protease [Leptolyngbyaceae cyanobacterium SL_7_1]
MCTMNNPEIKGIARELALHAWILGFCVALLWSIELVDYALGGWLNQFGILPRSTIGLRGIVFAPLLHGNFAHLLSNTIPFVVLGWLIMVRQVSDFFVVTAIAAFISGLGTWLFGAPAIHLGASGVIFGYLGFLLLRGYFERSFVSMMFSVLVAILYGGLVWGVLPSQPGISWEAHLFGFVGGGVAAWVLARMKREG